MIFKIKKGKYQLSFLILVRAQGLASPPLRSLSKAHRRPKVRLSLVVEPFFQCSLPYGVKNKKNFQTGAFLFWYAHRDWLRRHCTHCLWQPAYFVCLSLVVEPFFQCSLPYGVKNKKNSQTGAFLFWYAHRDSNPGPTD